MGRSRLENERHERLDRLASEVRRGGGLPLPLLFGRLLEELLDNGPTGDDRLVRITSEVLSGKTAKLAETWGGSWARLADDALQQLQSEGLVSRNGDGLWRLDSKFRAGENLRTIPARKGLNAADHVTVWEKAEREARSRASYLEAEAAAAIGAGRIRPVDSSHAAELRRSAAENGHIHRVVKDQYGRVLDGGHRLEADPGWPSKTIDVRDDKHALAISLDANRGQPLTKKTVDRINQLIGDLAGTNEARRDRIETELKRDASRTNLEIAELVGAGDDLVGEIRGELISENGIIHAYRFPRGRPAKDRERYHSADCWCGEGKAEPKQSATTEPQEPKLCEHCDLPWGHSKEAMEAEVEALRRADQTLDRDSLAAKHHLGTGTVQAARMAIDKVIERERAAQQLPEPVTEPEPDEHHHDWTPWIRTRQCIECGEQEMADDQASDLDP